MKKSIVLLLGWIFLFSVLGQTHPVENRIRTQFLRALRSKIRELEYMDETTDPDYTVRDDSEPVSEERLGCINLGNEGCVNGAIIGSGGDGWYLAAGLNPGK